MPTCCQEAARAGFASDRSACASVLLSDCFELSGFTFLHYSIFLRVVIVIICHKAWYFILADTFANNHQVYKSSRQLCGCGAGALDSWL